MERKLNAANHAEMRDLLGAFAIGAVDAEEAAAVRAYLATDVEAQEELAELMAGVDVLGLSVEPMEPPADLRDRISAAVRAEPAIVPPTVSVVPGPPILSEPISPSESLWSRTAPWAVAAAALLLVTLGLLFWNLQLRNQLAATPVAETVALAPTDAAPGASGEVRYLPAEQLFFVDVRNLPPLAEGQVYEVWLIGADGPVPAGVFDQATDQHAIVADRSLYDTLAITAEPGPLGTEAPTGEIVATAPL